MKKSYYPHDLVTIEHPKPDQQKSEEPDEEARCPSDSNLIKQAEKFHSCKYYDTRG